MGVVRLSQSEITDYQKYSSMLAGNEAFSPSAYDLLETTLISTDTASVTFSNLNGYSNYKHLQIRATMRNNLANVNLGNINLTFNSNSANYAWHRLNGEGSGVFTSQSSATSNIQISDCVPHANSATGAFGSLILDILDFSSTNKNTTIRALSGGTVAGESDINLNSGAWFDTSAVTVITINAGINSFISGSRFSLYGVK